ncbi:hypothetical protein B9Z55_010282 [Caenorhabditis nigoni]|uniref:Uncharacterized protein n=1 Tax=Caenorhabditis nigoni TaxID=1611254 RepID=A0A2G5UF61_9PELO|nr:hypothetical protein B9Z55_010282 [Caenorhabditis nigoni]
MLAFQRHPHHHHHDSTGDCLFVFFILFSLRSVELPIPQKMEALLFEGICVWKYQIDWNIGKGILKDGHRSSTEIREKQWSLRS